MNCSENFLKERQSQVSDWEYHFERVRHNEKLTDTEKMKIIKGFEKLREILGDDWLKKALREDNPIPYVYLLNPAPWSQLWLADLGEKLATLRTVKNFSDLRRGLRNKKVGEFEGAEAELEVASKLKNKGYSLELQPKINSRKADVRIEANGEEVYFEVTTIRAFGQDASRTHQALCGSPFTFGLDVVVGNRIDEAPFKPTVQGLGSEIVIDCKLYKSLAKPQIEKLQDRITKAVERAKVKQAYVEISEPGVIDYLVSHKSEANERIRWLKQKGMGGGCEGPPFDVDKTERITRKVEDKVKQLPKDKPGVIVIYDRSLVLYASKPHFYRDLAYQLEKTVHSYKNLIFGVIMTSNLAGKGISKIEQKPDYILAQRVLYRNMVQEDILTIKNRHSRFPINEKLLAVFGYGGEQRSENES